MGGRTAVACALAVWAGLLAGARAEAAAVAGLLAALLPLAGLAWRGPDRVGTVALLAALTLAAAARGGAHQRALEAGRRPIARHGPWFRLEARLSDPPQRASGEPVAVLAVERARPPLVRGTRIRVRLPAGCALEWGDRARLLAHLEVPLDARNPGGFDARAAADAGAVCATGRARWAERAGDTTRAAWPRATGARARRALERVYERGLSPEARALVVPLVVGDRSGLPPGLEADFRASGLVHLLALSGLHVVWLASLARGLGAALGGGVAARAGAGVLCALAYLALAGPLPSLARAAATETLAGIASLRGRALDPLQALALAALALLVACPGWGRDLGFQLSCAATLGLVTVGAWASHRAGRWRSLAAPVVATAAAQLTALPLLLLRFHAASWVAGFANLGAVPVSGLLLAAAWLGGLLEIAWPGAGLGCLSACEALARTLTAIGAVAARAPGALVACGAEPAIPWLAFLGAAALALGLQPPRDLESRRAGPSPAARLAVPVGLAATALALGLAATARPLAPPPGRAWLVALDVGQGDALALAHAGRWWLVDAGPRTPRFDAGERVVLPFLRWAGVRRLEGLVLTHDDGDHTGGAPAVLRAVRTGRVISPPPRPGARGPASRLDADTLARGDTLERSPLVRVLWPPHGSEARADAATTPDNAASLVVEVGEGAGRALLLADADSTVEEALAIAPGLALLKVGHHGSGSSSGAGFLARSRPRVAVISCGRRNPFGHPDPAALARLAASGARIERTDRDGARWYALDASGIALLDWRRGVPARAPHVAGSTGPRAPRHP
jgi:competence protein ComEC